MAAVSGRLFLPPGGAQILAENSHSSAFSRQRPPWPFFETCSLCGSSGRSLSSMETASGFGASFRVSYLFGNRAFFKPFGKDTTREEQVLRIVSMAHPRRVQMVGQQIRRELSEMLIHDKVLREAVIPETSIGSDLFLSCVASISEVEMSGDLQVAKVYVSVVGDERGKEIAMAGLKAKQGYVRSGLGKRMRLRVTPEVRFLFDDALERGSRVLSLLSKLKEERERREKGEVILHNADMEEEDDFDGPTKVPVSRDRRKGKNAEAKKPTQKPTPKFILSEEDSEDSDKDGDGPEYGEGENIIFIK